jgi:hypothetical protein
MSDMYEMQQIVARIEKLKSVLRAGGLDVEVKAEVSINFSVVVKDPTVKKAENVSRAKR